MHFHFTKSPTKAPIYLSLNDELPGEGTLVEAQVCSNKRQPCEFRRRPEEEGRDEWDGSVLLILHTCGYDII